MLTGNGDVLEPKRGIAAIGSGGNYALAAARALSDYEDDPPRKDRAPRDGGGGRSLRVHQRPRHPRDDTLFSESPMDNLTPNEIVAALDRHIVGQADAKRAVAVALRNRWRRQQPAARLRTSAPKNILMIGPTGSARPR